MGSRKAFLLLLLLLAVGSSEAATIEECGMAFSEQAGNFASCAEVASGTCPDSCKQAWATLVDCINLLTDSGILPAGIFSDPNTGAAIDAQQWFDQFCSGDTPLPISSPSPSPAPTPPTPDVPSWPVVNFTGWSSNFTCDTAAGFAWVPLNASLATIVEGADPASGPAVALNSSCAFLNTTGCCTQTPAGNVSWVQYGLGQPMVVQGLRLTAPAGDCCLGDDCLLTGFSEPCNERLINSFIYVSNSSVAELKASEEWAQYLVALNFSGVGAGDEDLFLWSLLTSNYSTGLCNVVNAYDLYADGTTDGVMINNGTVDIGCGLGLLGNGTANVTGLPGLPGGFWGGQGTGVAVPTPLGSYLTFARVDVDVPLALCGLQVCAKPANATAPPTNTTAPLG